MPTLGPELKHIADAIEDSRGLLTLAPDFDGEGSPAYSESTWQRAASFVARHAGWAWDTLGVRIDPPEIQPGPAGSIDIHWDHPDYELLVNVPADPDHRAGFYGDDRCRVSVKGTLDLAAFNFGLMLWLAKLK